MKILVLGIHAEALHQDDVWRVVRQFSLRAARRCRRLTFFVHPFWARTSGVSIDQRVLELAGLGHEIAQHTHFYSPDTTSVLDKTVVLTDSNVTRRLEEDFQILAGAGTRPYGFVAGAWQIPPALRGWLLAREFAYDSTHRTYAPMRDASRHGSTSPQPFWLGPDLLELPTTASMRATLTGLFRVRGPVVQLANLEYQLVYLHDHDLLDPRKRYATSATVRGLRLRGYQVRPASELATLAKPRVAHWSSP
ncbi:MAG: hypothetical protein ACRDQ2_20220 [Gaiellales bacterium]